MADQCPEMLAFGRCEREARHPPHTYSGSGIWATPAPRPLVVVSAVGVCEEHNDQGERCVWPAAASLHTRPHLFADREAHERIAADIAVYGTTVIDTTTDPPTIGLDRQEEKAMKEAIREAGAIPSELCDTCGAYFHCEHRQHLDAANRPREFEYVGEDAAKLIDTPAGRNLDRQRRSAAGELEAVSDDLIARQRLRRVVPPVTTAADQAATFAAFATSMEELTETLRAMAVACNVAAETFAQAVASLASSTGLPHEAGAKILADLFLGFGELFTLDFVRRLEFLRAFAPVEAASAVPGGDGCWRLIPKARARGPPLLPANV